MADTATQQAAASPYAPGVTLRSVMAMIFAMLFMGMMINFSEVLIADGGAPAEQALPIHAIVVFLLLLTVVGLLAKVAKVRLLTRNELFCVIMAMLISAPIMTQGMWHRFLSLIATLPRTGAFQMMDAYNDKLWPHGANLLDGGFASELPRDEKGTVVWNREDGLYPTLQNATADAVSAVTFTLPVSDGTGPGITPGEPYLMSFLAKPEGLASTSSYYCRVYVDDATTYSEIISSREPSATTFLHPDGFLRVGKYNVDFDRGATRHYRLELGLQGAGTLQVRDPKLFSVAALEGTFKGKKVVDATAYAALPAVDRVNLIVKPDNMWSPSGLRFLVSGYIPVGQWKTPAIAWSVPILLLLAGTLAINVLMRRQWAESERYPFPLVQVPHLLLGGDDAAAPDTQPFAPIWRNQWMWIGVAIALAFGLLKTWHHYDEAIPDVGKTWSLGDFLGSPGWGGMWNVRFEVMAFFVGICLFFELNVLFSLVIGFFLYRAQYWLGEANGWKVHSGYPFRYEQAVGSYLGYFLIVMLLTRKYLVQVVRTAFGRADQQPHSEAFAYRMALATLALSVAGVALWASWLEVAVLPMLLFMIFLLTLGFVTAKFRAECGLPNGYFTPYNGMLFVSLLGGMATFGAEAMLVCLIASGFITVSVFFFIPGAQLELLEYGRRYKMKLRHVVATCLIGALGGLFIGGWVFLSNSYALGGDTIRYQWAYGNKMWFFRGYQQEMQQETTAMLQEQAAALAASAAGVDADGAAADGEEPTSDERSFLAKVEPSTWGYLYGGGLAVVVSILRQLLAGFWFHPIGVILGSSHMLEWSWASILVAGVLRWSVLKLGGAATVRDKLKPLGVGLVLGSVLAFLVMNIISAQRYSQGITDTFGGLP